MQWILLTKSRLTTSVFVCINTMEYALNEEFIMAYLELLLVAITMVLTIIIIAIINILKKEKGRSK